MKYRSEHEEQCALIEKCRLFECKIPELRMLFAVPNGGDRYFAVGVKLKAEGVRAGVSDLFLSVPSPDKRYHGLYIEMKSCDPKTKATKDQREWLLLCREYRYRAWVCHGVDEAWAAIVEYLNLKIGY